MGRIKHTYLKRVADKLLEDYRGEFNTDFENNKQKVGEYTDVSGKSIRNKIAGYITNVIKKASTEDSVQSS